MKTQKNHKKLQEQNATKFAIPAGFATLACNSFRIDFLKLVVFFNDELQIKFENLRV